MVFSLLVLLTIWRDSMPNLWFAHSHLAPVLKFSENVQKTNTSRQAKKVTKRETPPMGVVMVGLDGCGVGVE